MFRFFSQKPVYLDYAAATPCNPHVLAVMKPYMGEVFFNPSSIYLPSLEVHQKINEARKSVANILGSQDDEIIFYDGATEANNMVIIGAVLHGIQVMNQKPHIITSSIEHPSVLEAFRAVEKKGWAEVTYLNVNEEGIIDLQEFKSTLKENTILVSIGYVNGETGVVQDIPAFTKIIRAHRKHHKTIYPYFHTDAVQAINYMDEVKVSRLGCDALTFNAAKIYGPKKIAALYKKRSFEIEPLFFGGSQERGFRPGTENVSGIVGLAKALEITRSFQPTETERLTKLHSWFITYLQEIFPELVINTPLSEERAPHVVNISFPLLSHEEIVLRLESEGYLCSMRSACKSGEEGDSHVILALREESVGLPTGSLRVSFGRDTSRKHLEGFVSALIRIVSSMKESYERYYKS